MEGRNAWGGIEGLGHWDDHTLRRHEVYRVCRVFKSYVAHRQCLLHAMCPRAFVRELCVQGQVRELALTL